MGYKLFVGVEKQVICLKERIKDFFLIFHQIAFFIA